MAKGETTGRVRRLGGGVDGSSILQMALLRQCRADTCIQGNAKCRVGNETILQQKLCAWGNK